MATDEAVTSPTQEPRRKPIDITIRTLMRNSGMLGEYPHNSNQTELDAASEAICEQLNNGTLSMADINTKADIMQAGVDRDNSIDVAKLVTIYNEMEKIWRNADTPLTMQGLVTMAQEETGITHLSTGGTAGLIVDLMYMPENIEGLEGVITRREHELEQLVTSVRDPSDVTINHLLPCNAAKQTPVR